MSKALGQFTMSSVFNPEKIIDKIKRLLEHSLQNTIITVNSNPDILSLLKSTNEKVGYLRKTPQLGFLLPTAQGESIEVT
eukprot:snap_masked-scaffold_61-processed-gene-0.46-mRNA-1 protein AED:1.00 eAED:1.00 QI:0/0/0/0/1/1/2/0/79